MEKAYVFVVCGAKEHTDTLQLSYSILRKKTALKIYVVTDNKRNEVRLDYPHLIDVSTPPELNHHQASIYLKTSLHKIINNHGINAYLDTDIIAYGNHPDGIFDQFISPIRFAPDHCKMNQFSPYAVNCGCMEMFEKKRDEVNKLLAEYDEYSTDKSSETLRLRSELFKEFEKIKSGGIPKLSFYFRYAFSWPNFKLSPDFTLNKKSGLWMYRNITPVMRKISMHKIARKANLKWNYLKNEMTLHDGRNLWSNYCHHLQHKIKETFGVNMQLNDWQHWNGGVFIFSDESKEFMDTWHDFTMKTFEDPAWKTRDQGTLIATVWKFGLQNHPTLDNKWNMILDYHYPHLKMLDDGSISLDGITSKHPEFVHIYHHWGDKNWDVWNKVMQKTGIHE